MLKDEKQADIAADGVIEFSIIDNKGMYYIMRKEM